MFKCRLNRRICVKSSDNHNRKIVKSVVLLTILIHSLVVFIQCSGVDVLFRPIPYTFLCDTPKILTDEVHPLYLRARTTPDIATT